MLQWYAEQSGKQSAEFELSICDLAWIFAGTDVAQPLPAQQHWK
jgi:hypothetical protein